MWTVKLSKQAADFLGGQGGKTAAQLEHGLERLSQDPYIGKTLKGELRGYWSLRVGAYRMIYTIQRQEIVVEVLRIHHRKEVYEKLRRL
jgi:mRNA interferase RelE/StbE